MWTLRRVASSRWLSTSRECPSGSAPMRPSRPTGRSGSPSRRTASTSSTTSDRFSSTDRLVASFDATSAARWRSSSTTSTSPTASRLSRTARHSCTPRPQRLVSADSPFKDPVPGRLRSSRSFPGTPTTSPAFIAGRTWVGMTTPRVAPLEKLGQAPPLLAKLVWAMPQKPGPGTTWVMALDESGAVVADLQTPDAPVTTVTGAVERRGELFCVSTEATSLLRFAIPPTT